MALHVWLLIFVNLVVVVVLFGLAILQLKPRNSQVFYLPVIGFFLERVDL